MPCLLRAPGRRTALRLRQLHTKARPWRLLAMLWRGPQVTAAARSPGVPAGTTPPARRALTVTGFYKVYHCEDKPITWSCPPNLVKSSTFMVTMVLMPCTSMVATTFASWTCLPVHSIVLSSSRRVLKKAPLKEPHELVTSALPARRALLDPQRPSFLRLRPLALAGPPLFALLPGPLGPFGGEQAEGDGGGTGC